MVTLLESVDRGIINLDGRMWLQQLFSTIKDNSLSDFLTLLPKVKGILDHSYFDYNIILGCCIVYNRPEFIKAFIEHVDDVVHLSMELEHMPFGCSYALVMALVKSLKYQECQQVLVSMFPSHALVDTFTQSETINFLCSTLMTSGIAGNDKSTMETCFRRLQEHGYDFSHTPDGCTPPLWHTVTYEDNLKACQVHLMKALLDFGADINETCPVVIRTVFTMLCLELNKKMDETTERNFNAAVKLCLYHNPSVAMNSLAVYGIICHDMIIFNGYKLGYFYEGLAVYNTDRLVPTLYMLGYEINTEALRNYIAGVRGLPMDAYSYGFQLVTSRMHRPLDEEFPGTVQECIGQPRRLKDMCRNVLRQVYTGRTIHRYVEVVPMTKSIKDFIILEGYDNIEHCTT